ncbi:hypothetical protein BH23PLA1_BH23PLA1_17400 [soil metagenome]
MSRIEAPEPNPESEAGPLGLLPSLSRRQARLAMRLARADEALAGPVGWLAEILGEPPQLGFAEVLWRGAGLRRSGAVAQLSWPRLGTRIGLGIEPALAHAIVDRLLGFERFAAEERLQVTPVEWGILSFVLARTLEQLDRSAGPLGPWDLTIDRVGPELFNPRGLGAIATVAWPIRIGPTTGTLRLWVPESIIALAMVVDVHVDEAHTSGLGLDPLALRNRFGTLEGLWQAEAGSIRLNRGRAGLRAGGVLPIDGNPLRGTVASPIGPIALTLRDPSSRDRYWFAAEAVPDSGGGRLRLNASLRRDPLTPEAMPMPPTTETDPGLNPAEAPLTLTVELGRISLPLSRLADLKPGDVLELARHAREPVELTSGGKLVARGELVQIDTELGVRVLQVLI